MTRMAHEASGQLTPTEREIVERLIACNAAHEELSLSDLAETCHVAKSTVVKTVKKLGFSGFQDYLYTHRAQSRIQSSRILPAHVVAGDYDEAVAALAARLNACRARNNVTCSGGGDATSAALAAYASRKLALLGYRVSASYDYALFDALRDDPGAVLFFLRPPARTAPGADLPVAQKSLVSYARDRGFTVIALADARLAPEIDHADLVIPITPDTTSAIDLFAPRALMLFEDALGACGAHPTSDDRRATPATTMPDADAVAEPGRRDDVERDSHA